MRVGSLFSGIGGIELGFEREGFKTSWFVENNRYCQAVLARHFPNAAIYGDITKLDFSKFPRVDVLTGGFPCQDISIAGKRAGIIEGKRSSLWREYARAIGAIRPRVALIENVPALANNGLDVVLADLAQIRYDAQWFSLKASDFGAPHRRERIFIVAYPSNTSDPQCSDGRPAIQPQAQDAGATSRRVARREEEVQYSHSNERGRLDVRAQKLAGEGGIASQRDASDSSRIGHRKTDRLDEPKALIVADDWGERVSRFRLETLQGEQGFSRFQDVRSVEELFGRPDIPEPLIRRGDNGFSSRLDAFAQKERISALGNAVVPQVAQFIARQIREKFF